MNLHSKLQQRETEGRPLRVGLIGAGKFGSMYLSQARRTPGMRLTVVADLYPDRARQALTKVGWPVIEQGVECGAVTAVGA
jgi:predicted homoserine dehydrogenase-like protein